MLLDIILFVCVCVHLSQWVVNAQRYPLSSDVEKYLLNEWIYDFWPLTYLQPLQEKENLRNMNAEAIEKIRQERRVTTAGVFKCSQGLDQLWCRTWWSCSRGRLKANEHKEQICPQLASWTSKMSYIFPTENGNFMLFLSIKQNHLMLRKVQL